MYVNAALNSRGRKPGQYPSAGPLAHLLDIWRAAAPDLDFIAPDIYDPVFTDWCRQYHTNGNPLFIPEIRQADANAARVFYALGEHDAMGFSPFSIENVENTGEYPLSESYKLLQQLLPLLSASQGLGKTNGVLLDKDNRERTVEKNGYAFTFRHDYTLGWDYRAKDENSWNEAGALIIELSADEYIVAGTGIVLTFGNTKGDKTITGISFIDEVVFEGGRMIPVRRLNGDENHQGRHLRIPAGTWSIQHVKLYDYK
jgi:beta-galactosidase GanA